MLTRIPSSVTLTTEMDDGDVYLKAVWGRSDSSEGEGLNEAASSAIKRRADRKKEAATIETVRRTERTRARRGGDCSAGGTG